VTISALASAGGTLVLAGVTVASVRSANRAARVAEMSLLAAQRPLIVPSRLDDPDQEVGFADDVWLHVAGSSGASLATDEALYLAASIRNIGTGIARVARLVHLSRSPARHMRLCGARSRRASG